MNTIHDLYKIHNKNVTVTPKFSIFYLTIRAQLFYLGNIVTLNDDRLLFSFKNFYNYKKL